MSKVKVKEISQAINKHYSSICEGVDSIQEVDAHECNNKNYQALTRGRSEIPKLLFKKFIALKDPRVISEILSVVEYSYSHGAKVPKLLKTDSGELFFEEEGSYYCAFEFYEGHHYGGTKDELHSAAKGLAELHKVLEGYNWPLHRRKSRLHQFLKNEELKKIRDILEEKTKKGFDQTVLDNLDKISQLYDETKERLFSVDLPKQLIHKDFHRMNGLFRSGELVVILDFDSMGISERVRDVAFSCYRFSRYTEKGLSRESMAPRASEFLGSYCSENPLTEEEIDIIPTLLIHEALKRVSYILRSHYFQKDTTWSFDLPKHLRTIEDAQYLKNIS